MIEDEKSLTISVDEKKAKRKRFMVDTLWSFVILVGFVFLFKVVFFHALIPSESMETTIMTNDFVFGLRITGKIHRGDVLAFKSNDHSYLLIKRVIGLPGDVIEIDNEKVIVNGEMLEEPYVQGVTKTGDNNQTYFKVPEDHYFFLGDNREFSDDARFWDNPYIHKKNIKAKAFYRYSLKPLFSGQIQ